MGIKFDYSGKMNETVINPRSKYEIMVLLYATGQVEGRDDSDNQIYRQVASEGLFADHVHVLCPPCIIGFTCLPGGKFYLELLFVSLKNVIYQINLNTTVKANGAWTSKVVAIRKNLNVEWGGWSGTGDIVSPKEFVKRWLKQCKLEPTADMEVLPIGKPKPGEEVQRFPNTSISFQTVSTVVKAAVPEETFYKA
jgi:hypothetical protein